MYAFFLCFALHFCGAAALIFEIHVANFLLQFNFVGRLLGPRGNSLKRVEASTDCRVLIRGRGSIKDPVKVKLRSTSNNVCSW